jgi:hypothetical protein
MNKPDGDSVLMHQKTGALLLAILTEDELAALVFGYAEGLAAQRPACQPCPTCGALVEARA